jgi:hypothetical protein
MGAPPASTCKEDATWRGRCPAHGGTHPTTTELMILLGKLTGWGDQSLSVSVGYKRARVWDAQDDSHLDDGTWGFTTGTRVCGQDHDVHAQGPTLEAALWALCEEVVKKLEDVGRRRSEDVARGRGAIDEFLWSHRVP